MNTAVQPRNNGAKNRWLTQFRCWHKWAGVVAGTFLLVTGVTGIVLNYRQPIFAKLGIETRRGERDASPLPPSHPANEVSLETGKGVSGGKVDFVGALALARAEWGEAPLDRIEIRASGETVTFRFRNEDGAEFWVDAADGRQMVKGAYERIGKPDSNGNVTRTTDWGKLLIDLHTGKIGGNLGKVVMTVVGVLLLLLTLTGFYLWMKPLFIRRTRAQSLPG